MVSPKLPPEDNICILLLVGKLRLEGSSHCVALVSAYTGSMYKHQRSARPGLARPGPSLLLQFFCRVLRLPRPPNRCGSGPGTETIHEGLPGTPQSSGRFAEMSARDHVADELRRRTSRKAAVFPG